MSRLRFGTDLPVLSIFPDPLRLIFWYPSAQLQELDTQDLRRWAKRAGLDLKGLRPKTARKTWESCLVLSYPHMVVEALLSQDLLR